MKVYVAGPLTLGDQMMNVRNAMEAGSQLLRAGHTPFVPHMIFFWNICFPESYEDWCAWDNEWLAKCDVLIRLSGESKGSDAEVALAESYGIPIWNSVAAFLQWTGEDNS